MVNHLVMMAADLMAAKYGIQTADSLTSTLTVVLWSELSRDCLSAALGFTFQRLPVHCFSIIRRLTTAS